MTNRIDVYSETGELLGSIMPIDLALMEKSDLVFKTNLNLCRLRRIPSWQDAPVEEKTIAGNYCSDRVYDGVRSERFTPTPENTGNITINGEDTGLKAGQVKTGEHIEIEMKPGGIIRAETDHALMRHMSMKDDKSRQMEQAINRCKPTGTFDEYGPAKPSPLGQSLTWDKGRLVE